MLIQAIILVCCTFTIGTDFTAKGRRKVQDANGNYVKITPANLAQLAPKAPEDVQKRIAPLLHDDEFIMKVVAQEGLESKIYARYEGAKQFLVDRKFKQLPNHGSNFVFTESDDSEEIWKVSGHYNRRENLTAEHAMKYGSSYDHTNTIVTAKFLDERFPYNEHNQRELTYQTASRVAHNLIANQFLKDCPVSGIKVVKEYLIILPEKANKVDDKSCVVISKKEKDINPLTPEALQQVPVERVVGLWALMRIAGGWNMTPDNVQINSKGELVWLDLEQPNSTRLYQLFNRDHERWFFNVTEEGERTLMLMLGQDSPHALAIEEAKKQNVLESKEKFNAYIQHLKNKSNDNNNG